MEQKWFCERGESSNEPQVITLGYEPVDDDTRLRNNIWIRPSMTGGLDILFQLQQRMDFFGEMRFPAEKTPEETKQKLKNYLAKDMEHRLISMVLDHLNSKFKGASAHHLHGMAIVPSIYVQDDVLLCSYKTAETLFQMSMDKNPMFMAYHPVDKVFKE